MRKILFLLLLLLFTTFLSAQEVMHINKTSIILNGAVLFVNGGIVVEPGSALNNIGTVVLNGQGAGDADFIDNSVAGYYYGPGTLTFTGTGTHRIKSRATFGNIQINNPVTLTSDINSFTWHLQNGRVITGMFKAIAISAASNAIEADALNPGFISSWFDGNLRRIVGSAFVNKYVFPVGDASNPHIAELDNLTANPLTGITYIDARFTPKPGTDAGLHVQELGASYTSVNDGGVWHLVPDANPSGGRYDLILHLNGFTGLADNSFALLMRPDASMDASDWQAPAASLLPPSNAPERIVAGGIARRNNLSAFGQAGIGMTIKPLPLTLLSFTAKRSGNDILLRWTTSHESNTSHFELLKGQHPGTLNYLDRVMALGNTTNDQTYNYTDKYPYAGVNYYRLKMVDRDNSFTFSQVIKINSDELVAPRIYPNPVLNNEIFIDLQGVQPKEIKLFAADGTLVRTTFSITISQVIRLNLPMTLQRGIYTVQVKTDKGISSSVIIVQ